MSEEVVRIATRVLLLIYHLLRVLTYGIEPETCRANKNITRTTLNDGVYAHAATAGNRIMHEAVVLIVITHQAFGTAYPQTAAAVNEKRCDGIVDNGGTVVIVMKVGGEMVTVKLVQAILRSYPNITVTVLNNTVNKRT